MYFLQNICSNAISVDRNSKNVLQIKKKVRRWMHSNAREDNGNQPNILQKNVFRRNRLKASLKCSFTTKRAKPK